MRRELTKRLIGPNSKLKRDVWIINWTELTKPQSNCIEEANTKFIAKFAVASVSIEFPITSADPWTAAEFKPETPSNSAALGLIEF